MFSLASVLDYLAEHRIRATYKAVGGVTSIFYRVLRLQPEFKARDRRTAWVVYKATRQPPPEIHRPRPVDSRLVTESGELVGLLRKHLIQPVRPRAQT